MEKRLFIAVLISIGFLMAWGVIMPRLFPELVAKKELRETVKSPAATEAPTPGAPRLETLDTGLSGTEPIEEPATKAVLEPRDPVVVRAAAQETLIVDRERFVAKFSNKGAQLVSFVLKNYPEEHHDGPVELVRPRPEGATDFPFAIRSASRGFEAIANETLYETERSFDGDTEILTFRFSDEAGVSITKEFSFPLDMEFSFSMTVRGSDSRWEMVVGPGIGRLNPAQTEDRFLVTGDGIVQQDGSFDSVKRGKLDEPESFGQVDYAGIANNYFVTVVKPLTATTTTFYPTETVIEGAEETRKDVILAVEPADGVITGRAYFGPKKLELLERYGLEETLQFGMFGFISRLLLTALLWVNKTTGNYGWSIVVLTFLIKIALFPLQHKSIVSMKKMQKIQPKMNAIRDKYKKAKTDPEQKTKMNTEMMKLYQREKINPMGGCFPILLQLPILWGFYMLLGKAIELRGAPWILWITDLSLKDPYYVTPILMTITMFIQQLITPNTADPMQRKIFLMMPIFFGFLFKEFSSGLVLYWLVQNVLTIIQQTIMNRWWKEHPEDLEKGTT